MRSNLRSCGTRHGSQFWTEEKEKKNFGLRYMEKCGWKQGDGLGSQRQGRNECVKTNYKNDNLGLGANVTQNEVMFKATMCMFNDILSRLSKKKQFPMIIIPIMTMMKKKN